MFETIIYEVKDGVARLSLNRPTDANAINLQMGRDLSAAAIVADEDPNVRAVLLTGNGRFFCAGGDLKSFAEEGEGLPAALKELTTYLHAGISRLARMDAPLIVAVNGAAAGAGMSLAIAGDLVLAADSARFTMAYTRAGLTPDGSSTYYLPRIVGLRRAIELSLTNRTLTAQEALEWGLVTRVVPDAGLQAVAEALAKEIAAGPTVAFGATKRLLHASLDDRLETQMELETRTIADMARSADGREGIAAFVEKRDPQFKGR